MRTNSTIEAYILAGGKSSRMGQDKGLLKLNDKIMIAYTTDLLSSLDINWKIISNNREYRKFNVPVIEDLVKDLGPIGGLYTALKDTFRRNILLMSCDTPFVTGAVIEKLMAEANQGSMVIPEYKNRLFPLCAIYPRNVLAAVETAISENKLKMKDLIFNGKHKIVNLDDFLPENSKVFANINTKSDLENYSWIPA